MFFRGVVETAGQFRKSPLETAGRFLGLSRGPKTKEPPVEAKTEPPIEAKTEPPIEAKTEPPIEAKTEPPALAEPREPAAELSQASSQAKPVADQPAPAATVPVESAPPLTKDNVDTVISALQQKRALAPEEIDLIRSAATTKGEKWNLPPALRGEVSHVLRGENLPRMFKGIDKVGPVDENGVATEVTSLRSHQPYSESMREPGGFLNTLKDDIDGLANFRGARVGTKIVRVGPGTKRILEVEVPPDTLSPSTPGRPPGDPALRAQFRAEAAEAANYATSKGVDLVFKEATK
jgi:hypothetical protein